eukprot:gene12917-15266_t
MYDESSEDHGGDAPVSYSENPYKALKTTAVAHGTEMAETGGDSVKIVGIPTEMMTVIEEGIAKTVVTKTVVTGGTATIVVIVTESVGMRTAGIATVLVAHIAPALALALGAPAVVNPLNPLAAVAGMPGLGGFPPQAMTQQATRHARRVYVGGLPPLANEQSIAKFFSQALAAVGGDAVVNVYINQEKKFAFVEFRTVEETSNAMALDGIMFEGVSVRVRRPNDYNPAMASTLGPSTPNPSLNLQAIGLGIAPGMAGMPGGMPGMVPQPQADGPDRIFVGGLPYYLNEEQIRELLAQFGELQAFDLVKDRETGNSKGYGFAVYRDPSVVDVACAGLNGLKMGDKTLTVRRATAVGQAKPDTQAVIEQAQQQIAISMALQQGSLKIGGPVAAGATKILVLQEIVDDEELKDDEAYEEIKEDMDDECGKYGAVTKIVIPRPSPAGEHVPGLGKVFVEYADTDGSGKAQVALNGRKFGGKAVKAEFMSEEKFAAGDFSE